MAIKVGNGLTSVDEAHLDVPTKRCGFVKKRDGREAHL